METNCTVKAFGETGDVDLLFSPCECLGCAAERAQMAAADASTKARVESVAVVSMDCCRRCGGSGYLPSFRHVSGGRCFSCN